MTTTHVTNRHGDEIRVGQHWTDGIRRSIRRTLRVGRFADAGSSGTVAVCTVIASTNRASGLVLHPNRVVEINIDRLHATASGRGYLLATGALSVRVSDGSAAAVGHARIRTVAIDAICQRCGALREVPYSHNFHDDGDWFTCDVWINPCGHRDTYAAAIAEAERQQAAQ